MSEVKYIDVGPVKMGERADVLPFNHPVELFNQNWIKSAVVVDTWPEKAGTGFECMQGHIWIPFDNDEPVEVGSQNVFTPDPNFTPSVEEVVQ